MEFKSELLLEFELYGQGVSYLDCDTIVTSGVPVWHCLDHAECLFVEGGMATAGDLDIFDRTGL